MTTDARPTVFISYSHRDERWKNLLMKHLGVLRDQSLIDIWQDRLIEAGADWHANIKAAMEAASIAVLVITGNSLTSEYILSSEAPPLLERRKSEGVRIFPLIAEPCAWQSVNWLRQMNLRPTDARPLSAGNESQIDADLAALASEIYLLTKSAAAAAEPRGKFVPLNPDDISIGRLPVTGRDLFGRELELDMLDGAWADTDTNVLTLVAWGGVGKSALVNHWRRNLARDEYRGAERVYAWSFYRQGTSEQNVSADQFIDAALRWFGDPDPTAGTPWDKGERLARLIRKQRTLLFLDGLEPLQFPPNRGYQEGALKEHSMQALLRELAAHNPGLCVITSRLAVADLADSEGDTVRRINLEHLSPQAGAEVLRGQGVHGEQAELEAASNEFGGHALALTLLGSYLANVYEGDIMRRDRIELLREDEEHGGHARRVMGSYEKWFGEGPELAVLRTLGLFDRPANGPSIAALRAAPAIPGLTDALQGITEEEWRRTLHRLRAARLTADRDSDHPDTLDAHPLVREYFKRQLIQTNPDAWREGNSRLYEHLRDTTKQFPDTMEEMAPLYTAVVHGCEANRHREALEDIYWQRILRTTNFYSTQDLGAFSAGLAVLRSFFEVPWQQLSSQLAEEDKLFVLNQAGVCLKALGQLPEASEVLKAGLPIEIKREEWGNANISAANISDLYLVAGDLSQALEFAEQSVELAARAGSAYRQTVNMARQASIIHQLGDFAKAEQVFIEAGEMQKQADTEFPFLPPFSSYQYCELLLDQGKISEAQTRTAQLLEYSNMISHLLSLALMQLTLGRSYLLQAQAGDASDLEKAATYLREAVVGLMRAGQLDELPRGLLARAALYRMRGDFTNARSDIDKAMSLAARTGMRLYQADCQLEYARLSLAQAEPGRAREHLRLAAELIEHMGYHRRDAAVSEIARELQGA